VPDIKWIKLATSTHEDEKMRLIDAMPERDTVHYLWIRLLIQAGKNNANGEIFLSEGMPYTDKMLAILFSRPLASIKLTLKTLSRLGMIEIDSDHVIRIVNWDKHQSIEGMERVRDLNRKRVENHREKKKQEGKAVSDNTKEEARNEETEENNLENSDENLNTSAKDIVCKKSNNRNKTSKMKIEPQGNVNDVTEKVKKSKHKNIDCEEVNADINISNSDNKLNDAIKITADDDKYNCNVTQKNCNVTQSESNITVMEQNKKEIENKKKNKRETEKSENIIDDISTNSICVEEKKSESFSGEKNTKAELLDGESVNAKALEIMHYHEKITGIPGGHNYVAISAAIDLYGESWVKKAIDIAFQKNHTEIEYIIGILKNWRKEGCPKDHMEVKSNGIRSTGKSNSTDKNEFTGFKPKEPRKLTEDERRMAETNLI